MLMIYMVTVTSVSRPGTRNEECFANFDEGLGFERHKNTKMNRKAMACEDGTGWNWLVSSGSNTVACS
jgi:hypothetical protein